jgi:hypothetical protein
LRIGFGEQDEQEAFSQVGGRLTTMKTISAIWNDKIKSLGKVSSFFLLHLMMVVIVVFRDDGSGVSCSALAAPFDDCVNHHRHQRKQGRQKYVHQQTGFGRTRQAVHVHENVQTILVGSLTGGHLDAVVLYVFGQHAGSLKQSNRNGTGLFFGF